MEACAADCRRAGACALGCTLLKEGANWYLRIFIDKETGVTIEDCEAVSRALDEPLDQADIIEQSYCLEVCSPGLERELVRDFHYERFTGSDVLVK